VDIYQERKWEVTKSKQDTTAERLAQRYWHEIDVHCMFGGAFLIIQKVIHQLSMMTDVRIGLGAQQRITQTAYI
jgi:hypothetical protein